MADDRSPKKPLHKQNEPSSGGLLSPLERYLVKQKQEKATLAQKEAAARPPAPKSSQKVTQKPSAPPSSATSVPPSKEKPSLANIQRPASTEPAQPASLSRWESVAENRLSETEVRARESGAPPIPPGVRAEARADLAAGARAANDVDFIQPITDAELHTDGQRNAEFGPRFIAWMIDACILLFITYFAEKIVLTLVSLPLGPMAETYREGFSSIIKLGVIYAYYGYFYSVKGASPGKMLLGLEVLDTDGVTRLTPSKAFFREAIGKLISFIPFAMGYIIVLIRADHRALHDLLFDTRVVRKNERAST